MVDLIEPYVKGGKTGLFGGAGPSSTVLISPEGVVALTVKAL